MIERRMFDACEMHMKAAAAIPVATSEVLAKVDKSWRLPTGKDGMVAFASF